MSFAARLVRGGARLVVLHDVRGQHDNLDTSLNTKKEKPVHGFSEEQVFKVRAVWDNQ